MAGTDDNEVLFAQIEIAGYAQLGVANILAREGVFSAIVLDIDQEQTASWSRRVFLAAPGLKGDEGKCTGCVLVGLASHDVLLILSWHL